MGHFGIVHYLKHKGFYLILFTIEYLNNFLTHMNNSFTMRHIFQLNYMLYCVDIAIQYMGAIEFQYMWK